MANDKVAPADELDPLIQEASAVADDLWARVSRTGQIGFPAGETSNALNNAARMIDRLIAQNRVATELLRENGLTAEFHAKCNV